jgi:caffeoyl-CoA O-methyltransferase
VALVPAATDRRDAHVITDPDIESYAIAHTTEPVPGVAALRAETEDSTPTPQMAGGLVISRLLEAFVVATRATRVLEIGTFTGVSALSIASRLPEGGRVVTLEANEEVAAIARRHIDASPWGDRVELVLGDALETVRGVDGPFDLVFIDAWKRDYVAYYEAVLPKLAPHGVIVADNVLWGGTVVDPDADGDEVAGVRAFAAHVHADDRVDNALLTVGDGLLVIWGRAPAELIPSAP